MRKNRNRRGFTLLEVSVALVIGVSLTIVLGSVIDMTLRTQHQITLEDQSGSFGQKLLADIRRAAFSSRRIYSDDAEGQGFFAALDNGPLSPVVGSRLPLVNRDGRLEPDGVSETDTGNSLMFAIETQPEDVSVLGVGYRVDHVRFVAFYLTERDTKVVAARANKIDVVRFVSGVYADYSSIERITDTDDKDAVIEALHANGVRYAWRSGYDVNSSFYALTATGSMASTPTGAFTIAADADHPMRLLLEQKRISVAGNNDLHDVPLFAQSDVSFPLFPSGFEAKVVGPTGARKLLFRLSLLAGHPGRQDVHKRLQRVLTVRDQ
jgi:prepilin-type N-terminal cleavage/methylation domain-containing protein